MTASNVTPSTHDMRAIGILDPRWVFANLDRANSSFTEANPRPGVPVAARNTGMVLETSGRMDNVAGQIPALTFTTKKAGMPGVQDSRFWWSPNYGIPANTPAYETSFGWDSPSAISRVELIGQDGGNTWSLAGCLRTQKNTVLLGAFRGNTPFVIRKSFDTAGYATAGTAKWQWSALAGIGLDGTSASTGMAKTAQTGTLCFIQLPEGRIHAYFLVKDSTVSSNPYGQVVMHWSDDDGITWNSTGKPCLNPQIPMDATNTSYSVTRMRAAYCGSQVLLLIGGLSNNTGLYTYVDTLFQYASADLGLSFAFVARVIADGGSDQAAAFFDVCALADQSGFAVSYSRVDPTVGYVGVPMYKTLGTAFTPWTTAAAVSATAFAFGVVGALPGTHLTGTMTTIACDENGVLSIAFTKESAAKGFSVVSYDNGVTWTGYNGADGSPSGYEAWWYSGDAAFYPVTFTSTFQCGRWLILTNFTVDTGEESTALDVHKLWEIDLGGYTTATRPFASFSAFGADTVEVDHAMVQFQRGWVAAQRLRDTTGWAETGSGGTETLNNAGYSVMVTGANTIITTTNLVVHVANVRNFEVVEWAVIAGTSQFELLLDDGTHRYNVRFQQSATQFTLFDIVAAANLTAPIATPSLAGLNQVMWSFDDVSGKIAVWIRASDNDVEVRPWVNLGIFQCTDAGTAGAAGTLRYFQGNNSTAHVRLVEHGTSTFWRPAFRNTGSGYLDTLYGRTWSAFPLSIYSGDGVRIAVTNGPSWEGDSWTVTQRHEYGIENLFLEVSPSPRKTWRSTSMAQQDIVVQLDYSTDPGPYLGRTLIIGGFNCNFQQVQVSYRTDKAAGWTALGTLFFNAGQTGLKWIRDGKMVRPDTGSGSTSATDYFTYNILEDSHVLISTGSAPPVLLAYRIDTNAEGAWNDGATMRTRLYCSGILGTENASGSAGEIWSKDGVLLVHDAPDVCELKFTIPASITAEGYFESGGFFVGHVAYFGKQYARGRALEWKPNVNLTTARSGTRRAQVQGPTRRSVTFGWANGNETDTTQIGASSPTPDYILPATGSAHPVATPADTPWKMAGLVDWLRGAATPCIYLGKVPIVGDETTDTTIINRNLFMLGRVLSDVHVDNVLGNEGASPRGELMRIATVVFEEEV